MFNASKSGKTSTKKFNLLEVVWLMKIQFPKREEIISAFRASENGDELTDRELWILSACGGDSE